MNGAKLAGCAVGANVSVVGTVEGADLIRTSVKILRAASSRRDIRADNTVDIEIKAVCGVHAPPPRRMAWRSASSGRTAPRGACVLLRRAALAPYFRARVSVRASERRKRTVCNSFFASAAPTRSGCCEVVGAVQDGTSIKAVRVTSFGETFGPRYLRHSPWHLTRALSVALESPGEFPTPQICKTTTRSLTSHKASTARSFESKLDSEGISAA